MAKKKVTTTVEEVEETPIDYKKDIENKSFEQVAEPPKDEPVKEDVKEEVKEEDTETIEFDPEQLKREAAEQAKQEVLESLKGDTKEETKENVSHYEEFQKEFFDKNNRQPTWFEVAEDMENQAILKLEQKQAEQAKAREDEVTKQRETENENIKATNKYVEDTLNELYTNEKLPRIQNKEDKDDYGLRVQNSLLSKVVEVNGERIKNNLPPKTIKEIFYEDFEVPRREVAGGNEPVNMGRGGYSPDDNQELDYRDISGPQNTFRNILSKMVRRG